MTKVDTTKYSNLTEAISNGEPIDFKKLDGRKAVLVDERNKVKRWVYLEKNLLKGKMSSGCAWVVWDSRYSHDTVEDRYFHSFWNNDYGRSIWVYGDIPLIQEKSPRLVNFLDTVDNEPTDKDLKNLDGNTAYLFHQDHGKLEVKLVYKNPTSGITIDTGEGRYPLHILLTYAFTNSKGWKLLVEETKMTNNV